MADDDLESSNIFALEALVRAQPANADAWVALAEYRWEQRRYADALADLNQAIRCSHEPEQVLDCYLTKGDLLLDAFPDRAADHYRRAVDLAPGLPGPHVRLALLALEEDAMELARIEAANATRLAQEPIRRLLAAALGELVASHHDFERGLFTRRLLTRLDTAGIGRSEDLSNYLVNLHADEVGDVACARRLVWDLLLRMVPLFWGGSGGDRNLVLPLAARAMVSDDSVELPPLGTSIP